MRKAKAFQQSELVFKTQLGYSARTPLCRPRQRLSRVLVALLKWAGVVKRGTSQGFPKHLMLAVIPSNSTTTSNAKARLLQRPQSLKVSATKKR